jgi:hypothetical protein
MFARLRGVVDLMQDRLEPRIRFRKKQEFVLG